MANKRDLTGQVFGKLTVLKESPERKSGRVCWECQCECGTIKIVRATDLTCGKTKSCGCSQHPFIDLTNQKFTKLTALYPLPERYHGAVKWHCKCACGTEVDVSSNHLRQGLTKSCGCYSREQVAQRARKDISGQRFGLLVALEPTEERSNGSIVWKCQCDCGNITTGSVLNLQRGDKISCGCLKESLGVHQIKELLIRAKIPYTIEQTFNTCIFPDTNKPLRFDFYINNFYLLEFDGKQHFYSSSPTATLSWNTPEHLEKVQKRDAFKNQWCKENKIPLIRIPYTCTKIKLEDIVLDTTKYRVV